jgi:hypothetical protein
MRKLNLESLVVESFDVGGGEEMRGTVEARQGSGYRSCEPQSACNPTCFHYGCVTENGYQTCTYTYNAQCAGGTGTACYPYGDTGTCTIQLSATCFGQDTCNGADETCTKECGGGTTAH